MSQKNNLTTESNQPLSIGKPMLFGAGIALALIFLFVSGVDDPDPEWGKLWKIKPLIVTPIVGAMGGLFFYFMDHLSYRSGLNKTVAIILGLIGYVIALWLGTILGLNGTLWD